MIRFGMIYRTCRMLAQAGGGNQFRGSGADGRPGAGRERGRSPHTKSTHVNDVCVGSRPGVVCQVEARMIGIFVNHDWIGSPEPIRDVRKVLGSHAKVRSPEPEPIGAAAFQTEHMARSEAQRKASVFPRTIHVIASIVTTHIVPHPLAIGMHMRNFRMPLKIAEIALLTAPLFGSPLLHRRLLLHRSLPLFGSALLLLYGSLPLLRSPLLRSCLPSR